MKILMVCLGNICRSPLAEGILAEKLKGHEDVFIDSAGTGGWHAGEAPDPRSVKVARNHGLDISGQRARKFTTDDFSRFDYIFAMDSSNAKDILELATSDVERKKVHLFLEFAGMNQQDVPDPWYGDATGFETVFRLLETACESVAGKLIASEGSNQ